MNIKKIFENKKINEKLSVKGWVKTHQQHGTISFINMNDGSSIENLQIVYKKEISNIPIGSAIETIGKLIYNEERKKYEFSAEKIEILSIAKDFPIQKKECSFEYLREIAHLRHRTGIFAAVNIIKNELFYSVHKFFNEEGFIWIQAPILTSNSCEGGAEAFEIKDSEKFFKNKALLSVSGQFHAETLAIGLKKVYTFGPTFRAEKSNSSNHLSEFWMIEPEVAFYSMKENLDLMERFIKYVIKNTLNKCSKELMFLQEKLENNQNLIEKLNSLVKDKFERIEYLEALKILKKGGFEVEFGDDLNSNQEKYITKQFNKPVFVINYPKKIKAFYMKEIDGKVVSSSDLLVPEIGELIGGSEREADLETLKKKAEELNIPTKDLDWYVNLRNQGYHSSAGFGCGFERLILYVTGLKNIRDAITYPRSYGSLNY